MKFDKNYEIIKTTSITTFSRLKLSEDFVYSATSYMKIEVFFSSMENLGFLQTYVLSVVLNLIKKVRNSWK